MTIGISKDTLIKALADHECNRELIEVLRVLINHCEELDPWLPIENAPKDRPILLFFRGYVNFKVISEYNPQTKQFAYSAFTESVPTNYQELPEDPKE